MLSTEREEFDKQLEVLFGGYPTFLTAPRKEAYWRGLQKMPLSVFVRCVDSALQDQSEEGKKLPTVNRIWELSRELKARAQPPRTQPTHDVIHADDYHLLGQRWLLGYLIENDIDESKLPKLVAVKNRIIEQFRASGDINGNVKEWWDVAKSAFEKAAA